MSWRELSSHLFVRCALGPSGAVIGLDSAGQIWGWDYVEKRWVEDRISVSGRTVAPLAVSDVAIIDDRTLYAITLPEDAEQDEVGIRVWSEGSWQSLANPSEVAPVLLDATSDGAILCLDANGVLYRLEGGSTWSPIPSAPFAFSTIAAAGEDRIVGLVTQGPQHGTLMLWNAADGWSAFDPQPPRPLRGVAWGGQQPLTGIEETGALVEFDGTQWKLSTGDPPALATIRANGNQLAGLGADANREDAQAPVYLRGSPSGMLLRALIARTATDPELRSALLADPVGTLASHGIQVPSGVQLEIVDPDEPYVLITLPPVRSPALAAGRQLQPDQRLPQGVRFRVFDRHVTCFIHFDEMEADQAWTLVQDSDPANWLADVERAVGVFEGARIADEFRQTLRDGLGEEFFDARGVPAGLDGAMMTVNLTDVALDQPIRTQLRLLWMPGDVAERK